MLLSPDALFVLVAALAIDAIVGDPDLVWRRWPHPVVWMGRMVAWGDRSLNRDGWPAPIRRTAGVCLIGLVVLLSFALGWLVEVMLRALPYGPLWLAAAASVLLSGRSLYDHVRRVERAFAAGGLASARAAVAMVVGRDPDRLDEAGVTRAAIETTAENFSDGVVAPALWFGLLGLPGLAAYKAVNTADSMIGHLSARHRDFGWASARLDDLVNLAPARLSGILLALAAHAAGGRVGHAFAAMRRDASRHRSPNAGWPESAMAGALDIALAGPRTYAAGRVDDPFLNPEGRRLAVPADIGRALRILVAAGCIHAVAYLAVAIILDMLR